MHIKIKLHSTINVYGVLFLSICFVTNQILLDVLIKIRRDIMKIY